MLIRKKTTVSYILNPGSKFGTFIFWYSYGSSSITSRSLIVVYLLICCAQIQMYPEKHFTLRIIYKHNIGL